MGQGRIQGRVSAVWAECRGEKNSRLKDSTQVMNVWHQIDLPLASCFVFTRPIFTGGQGWSTQPCQVHATQGGSKYCAWLRKFHFARLGPVFPESAPVPTATGALSTRREAKGPSYGLLAPVIIRHNDVSMPRRGRSIDSLIETVTPDRRGEQGWDGERDRETERKKERKKERTKKYAAGVKRDV